MGAVIAWVEPTIKPRLDKEINLGSDLRIEKECQTRVEEIVDVTIDQSRRGLLEIVDFKIDRAAQARAKIVVEGSDGEGRIEPVEKIIALQRACCPTDKTEAEVLK